VGYQESTLEGIGTHLSSPIVPFRSRRERSPFPSKPVVYFPSGCTARLGGRTACPVQLAQPPPRGDTLGLLLPGTCPAVVPPLLWENIGVLHVQLYWPGTRNHRTRFCDGAVLGRWWAGCPGYTLITGTTGDRSGSTALDLAASVSWT